MVLQLDRFDVMEYIWETLNKTPDGRHVRYTEQDVQQLWDMGFVDTKRIGILEWKALFEPMLQSDRTYLISHDQFLALDKYRYKGEIRIPFDAMLINEGKYTDEGLDELSDASIVPSCSLPLPKLKEFMNNLKNEFRESSGLIIIKSPAKKKIWALLHKHPSPLRNLELLLDHMLKVQGEQTHEALERAEIDAVTAAAAIQTSSFRATAGTRVEAEAIGLKALQKAKKKEVEVEVTGAEKTDLKKIRRSRKGIRG